MTGKRPWMRPFICGIFSCLVLNWTGCSPKPNVYVVPDSHDLKPGVICQNWPADEQAPLSGCRRDPDRVQITLGYLREIFSLLQEKDR